MMGRKLCGDDEGKVVVASIADADVNSLGLSVRVLLSVSFFCLDQFKWKALNGIRERRARLIILIVVIAFGRSTR